jgi:hypothetical protein
MIIYVATSQRPFEIQESRIETRWSQILGLSQIIFELFLISQKHQLLSL